jgi:signal transduction histidine kinase|tara:strand:- start:332 stop:847 length:516 start_codon:yes stop_codon:yes gene_type:complete
MPSIEYQGLKFSGGKFFIILSLIGAIIGGGWSGYRFYDDYLDMKQQVQDFVAPDLSEFDKKIDLAEAEMDKRLELIEQELEMIKGEMSMILEEVQLVAGVSSELKNDLKADLRAMNNDIRHITEIVNDVEDRQKEDTREVLDELKLMEEALDIKIDKALNNPLSGMSAKSK